MADEGISAGSVYVEVRPRVDSAAFAKIGADPAASKVGDDLGDRIGKAISKRIATSIREGIELGGKGLAEPAARLGAESGGRFADGFKTRLSAALRSLPKVELDANSSDADRAIAALRARIEELRDKKIGVDISAEKALADIRDIQARLTELGSRSPNIQVKTDAGAAAAQLAALQAQVNALSGQNVNINTNASTAAKDVNLLVSAGLALGPAIVPGAVAAAAAVLSIGAAATSAFVGIGVGALAFHGVGDAVKALDTAQAQAAKTGSTLVAQQKSLAGGADQVRSAEASLASARAQAADGAVRAEEQVVAAQQSAVRAQRDLNDAIDAEKKSRQDLTENIKGNALDQQQAALDVTKARIAYEQQASEQNRISFEQAKLRAEELGIQGKRLAAEQSVNNKTTVEGSQRVTDAKAKEVAAQQAVADAERARTAQARQSAQQIAQASQAVVTAQRGIAAATVAAGATGGAAIDALAVSMGNLPVSAQAFSRFLFGLKGDLLDLQGAAADGVLPGAQAGIQVLLPYFGDLRTFVGSVATELGSLERRAAETFTAPYWRSFFGFIAGQAVPNMELMFQAGINVAEALARIVQGFSPVQSTVGGGIANLTKHFVDFSRSLDTNKGFQNFVAYATAEVPHVLSTIEALAGAGLHIVQAYAPVGSTVVSELKLLATVINAIPVPVITALATAVTAYKTVALLTSGVQKLLNSDLVAGAARMLGFSTATATAGGSASAFRTNVASASAFIGGPLLAALSIAGTAFALFYAQQAQRKQQTDAAAQGLAGLGDEFKRTGHLSADTFATFAKGKPEVLELTAALKSQGLTLDDLGKSYQNQTDLQQKLSNAAHQHVKDLDAEVDAAIKAGEQTKRGTPEREAALKHLEDLKNRRNLAKQAADEYDQSLVKAQENEAIYAQATTDAATATIEAGTAIKGVGTALGNTKGTFADYSKAIDDANGLTGDAAGKAGILAIAAERVGAANVSAADRAKLFGNVLADLGSAAATSGPVFDGLATAFSSIAQSALDANDKGRLLKQTLDQMYGAAISQTEAAEAQVRTQDALTTQLGKNSAGFDLNKAKTTANRDAILGNRDALEAALQAARDKYTQDIANGIQEDKARATHDLTIKSIVDGIPKTQRQTAAVKDLVSTYGSIPPDKHTDVTTPGLDKAIDDLITAHAVQLGLDKSWTKQQIADEAVALHDIVFGRQFLTGGKGQSRGAQLASGGPVAGPGGPRDDLIPAMLSDGEFVQQAAAVDEYGVDFMHALNQRKIPRQALPGFASGGLAGFPINIPTSTGSAATLASLWQQWAAAQAALSAGGTGSADLGIAKTIADVARGLNADHKVLLSAMETALVESGMHNLRGGDRDSVGVFQQRPSQGWGSPSQILNVAYAARQYLTRAIANEPRFAKATPGQLAQSVQRSAFPGRYDQRAAQAEAIITALSGGEVSSGLGLSAAGTPGGSEQIKAFIRSTDPLPYVFGAAGPGGYDCSGLSSAIFGLATGRGGGHGQRYFTTFDFANGAPAGLKPGPGGTLTFGVNPTTHMAGVYGGLGFEAASTKTGIKIGASARKPSTFQKQFHLADGGAVSLELLEKLGLDIGGDPSGMTVNGRKLFDTGGYLPPGLSVADNRTGSPEAVLTDSQWDAISRVAARPTSAPDVRVYIGNEEITSRVRVEVDRSMDRVAASVGSGVRDF